MKALFVMNGASFGSSGSPNVSGGDLMLIEIAKRWTQRGVEVHFLTSSAGKELCDKLGLKAVYHLSHSSTKLSISRYIFIALRSAVARTTTKAKTIFDIVYSSNEHLYDVLPAFKMKKRNVEWVAMVHFVPPPPWTRVKAGKLNAILYYLNHMLGALIIRNNADLVFAVSQTTASDYIRKLKFDGKKVVAVAGGVNYGSIRAIADSTREKNYDAIFMKRLQPMKGVFDVIKVWRQVVNASPNAKLLILGDGPADVVARMHRMITELGLVENIEMIGPVYDIEEKISLLARSKLFLLPSYEENWAIVIGEALTVGLPVVAYDLLELKEIWGEHVLWIPKGNVEVFAAEVINLLSNDKSYQKLVGNGINLMKQFDWDNIAKRELDLCIMMQRDSIHERQNA